MNKKTGKIIQVHELGQGDEDRKGEMGQRPLKCFSSKAPLCFPPSQLELIGHNIFDFIHPCDQEELQVSLTPRQSKFPGGLYP